MFIFRNIQMRLYSVVDVRGDIDDYLMWMLMPDIMSVSLQRKHTIIGLHYTLPIIGCSYVK